MVGTYSFILDLTLEATTKFAGSFSQGCYVCRLENHNRTTCTCLIDKKRFGNITYDSNTTTTPNNSSITTNTRINPNTNNQGPSTQRIQVNKISTIV